MLLTLQEMQTLTKQRDAYMVVLNCYGKIERICISSKLGLFLSNLPDSMENNWKEELEKELNLAVNVDKIYQEHLGTKYVCGIYKLYHKVFPEKQIPENFTERNFSELAEQIICISLDYSYEDMPLGGWDTNCFDGRLCEDDYTEKIIEFINFLSHGNRDGINFPSPVPQWVYSSNHDEINHYRLFWGGENAESYIDSIREWGKIFDEFLDDRESYLLFDYLVNSLYKDDEYNEQHLMKDFSLCQMFLENKHEAELDIKLQRFLPEYIRESEKQKCTKLLRQLRNKIAHGDFMGFEEKVEEYAVNFMDGRFAFDYSEYSRKNWAISNICCLLDDILRRIIYMLFYDKDALSSIKGS